MAQPILLALVSAAAFLGLAHAAVSSDRAQFLLANNLMAMVALLLVLLAPAAGVALLAPVLLSRRLAAAPVPATVDELLARSAPVRHPSQY